MDLLSLCSGFYNGWGGLVTVGQLYCVHFQFSPLLPIECSVNVPLCFLSCMKGMIIVVKVVEKIRHNDNM